MPRFFINGEHVSQHAVDAVAQAHHLFLGLDVDVGRFHP